MKTLIKIKEAIEIEVVNMKNNPKYYLSNEARETELYIKESITNLDEWTNLEEDILNHFCMGQNFLEPKPTPLQFWKFYLDILIPGME